MYDPQREVSGDGHCPRPECDGWADYHRCPPDTDIYVECEECGSYRITDWDEGMPVIASTLSPPPPGDYTSSPDDPF